jgi:intracellular sulfur oxidation DsrE/DsrF family protein
VTDKWVFQVSSPDSWPVVLNMIDHNIGVIGIRIVVIGPPIVPLFAHGTLRMEIEKRIKAGIEVVVCSFAMATAGLTGQTPPAWCLPNREFLI